jgi:hypothetical protein
MRDIPLIRRFLRREADEQTVHVRTYSPYTQLAAWLLMEAVERHPKVEVVRRTNFQIGYGEACEVPVSWESCEVGPEERRHLVTGVFLFVVHHGLGDLQAVLALTADDGVAIRVVVRSEDAARVGDLLAWLDVVEEEHHPLKGRLFALAKSGLSFLAAQRVTREDLVLPDEVVETVERNFAFLDAPERYPEALRHRALLLAGQPGIGKTMLAKWLSGRFRCTGLWVTPGAVWEIGPAAVFDLARRLRPTLLILEDLDVAAGARGGQQPLGDLLGRLDGFNDLTDVAVIATTNHPEALDEALDPERRPGRFNRLLRLQPPDEVLRARLLRGLVAASQVIADFNEECIGHLVAMTEQCTGAQIAETVRDLESRRLWMERDGREVGPVDLLADVSGPVFRRHRAELGFALAEVT